MDLIILLVNVIWAGVVLCGLGVVRGFYLRRNATSVWFDRVTAVEARLAQFGVLETKTLSNMHEIDAIRAGLEKLKAIPPKAPRL